MSNTVNYTSIEYVTERILNDNLVYWRLFSGSTSDTSFLFFIQNEDLTSEQSALLFANTVKNFTGRVKVELTEKSGKEINKGGTTYKMTYFLNLQNGMSVKDTTTVAVQQPTMNNELLQLFLQQSQQTHAMQIEALRREFELKQKIAELEADTQIDSPINGFLEAQSGRIMGLLEKFLFPNNQPQVAIAGGNETIEQTELTQTEIEQLQQRLNNAILTLAEVDSNYIETLELLADFAKSNPDKYKSYIPLLK